MDSLKKPLDTREGITRIQILKETFERVEPISPRTQIRQHRFLIQNQLDKALVELNAQKKENYILSRERDELKFQLYELSKLLKSNEGNQNIQMQNNNNKNNDNNDNNSNNNNNNDNNNSHQNNNIIPVQSEGKVPSLPLSSNAPLSPLSRASYSSHHFEQSAKEENGAKELELNLSFLEQANNNASNEGEKSKKSRRNSLRGDKSKEQKKRRKSSEIYDDKKPVKDKEFQNIIQNQNAQLLSQEDNIKRLYKESCELIEEYKTVVDAQSMEINNLKNQLEQIITLAEKFEQRLNFEISSHNETRMQLEFQMLAPISQKKKGSSSYDLSRYPGDLSHNNPNLYHHLPYSYTSSSNLIDLSELKATKKKGLFKSKKAKVTELNSPDRSNSHSNNNSNNNSQNYKFNVENPEPKQMSIEQLKREMEVVIALGEKLQSELKIEKDLHLQTQKQFFEQKNIVDNLLEANRQLNTKIRSASNKFITPSNSSNNLLSNNSNPNLSNQNNSNINNNYDN